MAEAANTGAAGGGGELPRRIDDLRAFGRIVWRRFGEDKCLRVAASLSYTSLLALVPLVAVGFAVLSAFPVFETVQKDIQAFVFENFLPSAVDEAQAYIDQFVGKARGLTGPGIIGLALTAMLLLSTIESAMNAIFRVTRPRPLVPRVLVFWAVLTLGPLLLGASFSLSTYMVALTTSPEIEAFTGPLGRLARVLPLVLAVAGFTVFFTIIPNRPVKIRHALIGGLVSGILLSGLRYGFAQYVTHFPTYETLYGALATVPIFLVWMYLSWVVVLIGAVVAAALPSWRRGRGDPLRPLSGLGSRLRHRFAGGRRRYAFMAAASRHRRPRNRRLRGQAAGDDAPRPAGRGQGREKAGGRRATTAAAVPLGSVLN